VYEDGRVHPSIMALQRSRRFSTTEPGLTVTSPDHKDLYIADSDDDLLVEFDYSNADARAVAAYSGDREFAKRFLPGADGHMINALAAWGAEAVATNPAEYRQRAKAPGHGWGYKIGARKMALTTGMPEPECKAFLVALNTKYPGVVAWQDRVAKFARMHGYVVNDWGTRLVTEPGREVTQGPALLGQNATHELLLEGCVRLPDRLLRRLKLTVHDAVLMSLAKATLDSDIALVIRCSTRTWHPKGGQAIHFPLSHGEPGRTWAQAAH
jgi:DNA polymerase-1